MRIAPRPMPKPAPLARLTPAGVKVLKERLATIDAKIKVTQQARDEHQRMMTLARFGPEGLKAAQATLAKFDAQLKFLNLQKREIEELLQRS